MTLLDLMKVDKYWEQTYERMCMKKNLSKQEANELLILHLYDFKDKVIKQIEQGHYEWSIPNKVYIGKMGTSKKRVVYVPSLQDRYVLGVLYRVMSDLYQEEISPACFSYKKGVRTLGAVHYLMEDKQLFHKYGVKLDISSYFNSVDRDYLGSVIKELFKQDKCGYKLMMDFYMRDKCYENGHLINEYMGLVPGSALSSFFANYCLRSIDWYLAGEEKITYARYSDDIILFHEKKEQLEKYLGLIKEKLKVCGLSINESKYKWFEPGDTIQFLGLNVTYTDEKVKVDISDVSKDKMKYKIRKRTKSGRKLIEVEKQNPYKVAEKVIKEYNHRVYKCYIQDKSKYGWAYYAFRYINTIDSLQEIDYYLKDRVRQMITGKNNSANIRKVTDEKLRELGYVSLVEMYYLFKSDFDLYCEEVYFLK